jgi:hypothetical protein
MVSFFIANLALGVLKSCAALAYNDGGIADRGRLLCVGPLAGNSNNNHHQRHRR